MAVVSYFPYAGQTQDLQGAPEDWALEQGGIEEKFWQRDFSIAAADSNGSTYCLMHNIPASMIITQMSLEVEADAQMTSVSIGLFDADTGVAKNASCYANALNVAAGSTKAAPFDGMTALTFEQTKQRVFELAGDTNVTKKSRYDLVMTVNAVPGDLRKVTVRGRLVSSV